MNASQAEQIIRNDPVAARAAHQTLHRLLAQSATDPALRRQLLEDPTQVLSERFGEQIPADYRIAFVENRADATFVLPDPVDAEAELSEEELLAVSGGATTSPVCSVISVIALTLWAWDEFVERD